MPSTKSQACSRPWGAVCSLVLHCTPCKWVWKDGAPLAEEQSPDLVGGGWSGEGMEWGSRAGRAWR